MVSKESFWLSYIDSNLTQSFKCSFSNSIHKEAIPSDQLFYASHISGSPFMTLICPGSANYPHSTIVPIPNHDYNFTIAGNPTYFFIEARDSNGNIKSFDSLEDASEQFTTDTIGKSGVSSGKVTFTEGGTFRVDYNLLKAGNYTVHVKTRGTDIYFGRVEINKCSTLTLEVVPGMSKINYE
jgi:hypothetical protein